MRKIISILCALTIVLSMSAVSFAAEAPAQEVSSGTDTFTSTTGNGDVMPCEQAASFNNLQPGKAVYVTQGRIDQGVTKLHISDCTWFPTSTIWIGFSSISTGKDYIVEFDEGSIDNFDITTENVPSGSYNLMIYNKGSVGITSGTLYYEWQN